MGGVFMVGRKSIAMASAKNSILRFALVVISAGIILFLAVFVGIQIGHAFKGDDTSSVEAGASTGQPLTGDPIPSLKLYTDNKQATDLREVVSGGAALVAFTMPGCSSCSDLLSGWETDGISEGRKELRIIVVVATPPDDFDAGELAQYGSAYPLYFCDNPDLYFGLNVRGLPAVLGITAEGAVSFFSNEPESINDPAFIESYL